MAKTFRQASRTMMIARGVSIADYARMVRESDKNAIADFLQRQFRERYVDPHLHTWRPSGFAMMATSCLMIETLQCFRTGEPETGAVLREPNNRPRYGHRYFRDFFRDSPHFAPLGHPTIYNAEELAQSFYKNVRCGILHQGETTDGWLVRRDGPLFADEPKTLNARLFLECVDASLSDFASELRNSAWDSDLWGKFRAKMDHTVAQGKATVEGQDAEA